MKNDGSKKVAYICEKRGSRNSREAAPLKSLLNRSPRKEETTLKNQGGAERRRGIGGEDRHLQANKKGADREEEAAGNKRDHTI